MISLITEPFDVAENAFTYLPPSSTSTGVEFVYEAVFTNASLTVPFGSLNNYNIADGWKSFKQIAETGSHDRLFKIDCGFVNITPVAVCTKLIPDYHNEIYSAFESGQYVLETNPNGDTQQFEYDDLSYTEGLLRIYKEGGYWYHTWRIGDNIERLMKLATGKMILCEAIDLIRQNKGKGIKGINTYVQLRNINEGEGNIYLCFFTRTPMFAYAELSEKDESQWYEMNSNLQGNMLQDVHVSVPTPEQVNNRDLTPNDLCRDLQSYWIGENISCNMSLDLQLTEFKDVSVSFRFTTPKKDINACFDTNTNGTWNVPAYSKYHGGVSEYTLHLSEPVIESNGQTSYKAIYDQDDVCIVRIVGNHVQYQYNDHSDDILNWSGRYDNDGYNAYSTYMGSLQAFTANVEVYTTNTPYEMILDRPFMNLRFIRPLNTWNKNVRLECEIGDNISITPSDLISACDWRGCSVNLNSKTERSTNSIGFGYYGISELYVNPEEILTDYLAEENILDEISSLVGANRMYQEVILEKQSCLTPAFQVSNLSCSLTCQQILFNGLKQSKITYSYEGKTYHTFHLFVPIYVKYNWGKNTDNPSTLKTWAIITVDPMQELRNVYVADKQPLHEIEPCENTEWHTLYEKGGHVYDSLEKTVENEATHQVVYNEPFDIMSCLDIHYSEDGVYHQMMTDGIFKENGLKLEFMLVGELGDSRYCTLSVERLDAAPYGISSVIITPRNVDDSGSTNSTMPATREVIGRKPVVRVLVTNEKGGVYFSGYVMFEIVDEPSLNVGDVFLSKTTEDVELFFMVTDSDKKECWVGDGFPAVKQLSDEEQNFMPLSTTTHSTISIPAYANGYKVVGISEYAFAECVDIHCFNIPEGVDSIAYGSFALCHSLASVKLPNSIKYLGQYAFYNCQNLTSVEMGGNMEKMGEAAFADCKKLINVKFPDKVESVEPCIFYGCESLENISVPDGIEEISESMFSGCIALETVDLANSIEIIKRTAFYNCSKLSSVGMPNNLKEIGAGAFAECSELETILLPNSLEIIREQAFSRCSNLSSLFIPKNVRQIELGIVGKCNKLESLNVSSNNPYFDSRNGCNGIIEKATNMLVQSCRTTIIPNDIVGIGDYGYIFVNGVEEITIPENIKSIGYDAFQSCRDLKRVTIPYAITTIADEAFLDCRNLEDVIVLNPNPIPINDNVFYRFFESDPNVEQSDEFTAATLYVPKGSRQKYAHANGWNRFPNIVEMASGATAVDGISIAADMQDIYYVDGKKQHEVSHGLNIVRMSDGTVRKVVKK